MHFERYTKVPNDITEKVLEEVKAQKEARQ
jgi:hypothetical protein